MKAIAIAAALSLLCASAASAEEKNRCKEENPLLCQDALLTLAGLGAIGAGIGAALASTNKTNQQDTLLTTTQLKTQSAE